MPSNQPNTSALSAMESLYHLSFRADMTIRQAFGESLDSAAKMGIPLEQLAAAFEPLLLREVDTEAWAAIPELVHVCCKAHVSPCEVFETICHYLPIVDGQPSTPLSEPLFRYLTTLVPHADINDIRLELNSILTMQQLLNPRDFFSYRISPFEAVLGAATLELDDLPSNNHPRDASERRPFPLETYSAELAKLSFAPDARALLLAMVSKNNENGNNSALLRDRFLSLMTPAKDGTFLPEESRSIALRICKYYLHQAWGAESLLPVLHHFRASENTPQDSKNAAYFAELHSQLCMRGIKFETLSSFFLTSTEKNRPHFDEQSAKVAVALSAVLPAESISTPFSEKDYLMLDRIKNAVYSTAATFKTINAKEFDYQRLERLIRTLKVAAPENTDFPDACSALLQEVRRAPFAAFCRQMERKYSDSPEFIEASLATLDAAIGRTNTWPVHDQLIRAMVRLFSYSYKHDLNLPELIVSWSRNGFFSQGYEYWRDIHEALDLFMTNKLPLHVIGEHIISRVGYQDSTQDKQLVRLIRATEQYLENHPRLSPNMIYFRINLLWNALLYTEANDQMVRMVERAFRSDELTIRGIKKLLTRDLPMYAIIQRRLALRANPKIEDAIGDSEAYNLGLVDLENDLVRNDHPPHIIHDTNGHVTKAASAFYLDTLKRYERMYDQFNGFSANMFEARSYGGRLPALAQFALDCAVRVHAVNASSSDEFPGRGFFVAGLLPEQFLSPDPESSDWNPTYNQYKKAWPHLAEQIDDIGRTAYLTLRGILAVIPPMEERYHINGHHYSYVVFNEHFENYKLDIAYLVPTSVIQKKLSGTLAPYDSETGEFVLSDRLKDINEQKLTAAELQVASNKAGLPMLNVGWGSNHSGGFCNAFPPGSAPYHQWEAPLFGKETQDAYGHVHKSHRFGEYRHRMDRELEQFFTTMREADTVVRSHLTRCQNLFELFQIAQAYWHRGYTLPRRMDDDSGETFSITIKNDNPSDSSYGEPVENDAEVDPSDSEESDDLPYNDDAYGESGELSGGDQLPDLLSARMLVQAYEIHADLNARDAQEYEYPVLCITTATRYSSAPNRAVLDTLHMTYYDGYEWQELPPHSNGTNDQELAAWQSVLDQVNELDNTQYSLRDLRWMHRAAASHLLIDRQK